MLLLLLPFVGFILLFVAQQRANAWAGFLAIVFTSVGLVNSIWLGLQESTSSFNTYQWNWLILKGQAINFTFKIDPLALAMLVLVHLIALLVQVYSLSYMRHEGGRWRYFAFLQLFVFSMLGIVMAGNLLVMYVFWELVGLCSYLLIGFWYEKPRAVWAAKKAFLLNRVGDVGFLAGILLLIASFPTLLQFDSGGLTVAALVGQPSSLLTLVGVLLFCGTMGKSAQFPLAAWLPDAMEGPTPVSALIHAATMVAAGVYLLARIHFLLTPDALLVVAIIGTITTLWGAYKALFQTDVKRLLAYSTISQLGLMVVAMGVNAREASLFHLFTHAFFKAGLFLCAGVIIHHFHSQDTRQMGGLRRAQPLLFWSYTLCAAALVGMPFTTGFLSKDLILIKTAEWAYLKGGIAISIPLLCMLTVGLTAAYMVRQWRMVFLDSSTLPPNTSLEGVDETANLLLLLPIAILALLSIFIWFSWHPFTAESAWLLQFFDNSSDERLSLPPAFVDRLHLWVPMLTLLITFVGLWVGYASVNSEASFFRQIRSQYLATRHSFERLTAHLKQGLLVLRPHDETQSHTLFLIAPLQKIAHWLHYFDRKIIDIMVNGVGYLTVIGAHVVGRIDRILIDGAVNGLAWTAAAVGNRARRLQNGQIQSYFVVMLVGVLLLMFWILR